MNDLQKGEFLMLCFHQRMCFQARINQELEHFLIVPYGMMYHEVTASSLIKVDMRGEVIDTGTTNLSVNATGFSLHAAIHAARPDIRCVLHLQASSAIAVSLVFASTGCPAMRVFLRFPSFFTQF